MSSRSLRALPSARGGTEPISPRVDEFRRGVQLALPFDSAETIVVRTGTALRCVRGQIQGEHPLTVKVAVEATRLFHDVDAGRKLWDDLLAPLGLAVIDRPNDPASPLPILAATGGLMSSVGQLERSVGAALEDNVVETAEQVEILRDIEATHIRLHHLEQRVRGVA
jgi:hypothetical protein